MFSDVEGFALLYMMRAVDDARVAEHAKAVVDQLGLDPRLALFIPLQPSRGKSRKAYDRLLAALGEISRTPEPDRTRGIEQLHQLVASNRR